MNEIEKKNYDLDNIKRIAEVVSKSGLVSEKSVEKLIVQMLIGRTFGLDPIQAVLGINIIETWSNGKPQANIFIKPKMLASQLLSSGKYRYDVKEITDDRCELEFFVKDGENWKSMGVVSYTMEEAKQSGIALARDGQLKENYRKNPKEMLFYRCMQRGVSFFAPDVIFGLPIYLKDVEEWTDAAPPQEAIEVNPEIVNKLDDGKENEKQAFISEFELFEIELNPNDFDYANEQIKRKFIAKLKSFGINPIDLFQALYNKSFEIAKLGELRKIMEFLGLTKNSEPNQGRLEQAKLFSSKNKEEI